MDRLITLRWVVFVCWIAAIAALLLTSPSMAELIREKGGITIPDGAKSTIGEDILAAHTDGDDGSFGAVLVFHREQGLTEDDRRAIKAAYDKLDANAEKLGVVSLTTVESSAELKDRMLSKDGTTEIALVEVDPGNREIAEVREQLQSEIGDADVPHYFTGAPFIDEDVIISSEEGLKKTEWITVVFILAVLLLVFRSPIAALIPLLTVGMSYAASGAVVAFLAEYADFPISNFTQIFMVAVLFGIGTDYCILLLSRFKEELAKGGAVNEAVKATYRTAGKTVIFSALAGLVGFAAIGLSEFKLYKSAVAVAVGISVLMLALSTLVPFFMSVLGKIIFWPAKGELKHKPNRLWGAFGAFSASRPLVTILIIAAVSVPLLVSYNGSLSYDSLSEIGDGYDSVKGFQIISDRFGPGESLPTKLIIESDEPLDTEEGLAMIERVSREVSAVPGVAHVRGATRPLGEPIAEFEMSSQLGTLAGGLGEGRDGIDTISSGLSEAANALDDSKPKLEEASAGVGKLIDGTKQLQSVVGELTGAIDQLERGVRDGSAGAEELRAGLEQARVSAERIADGGKQLSAAYEAVGAGLQQLSAGYDGILSGIKQLQQGLAGAKASAVGLGKSHPELTDDPQYAALTAALDGSLAGAEQLSQSLAVLNAELAKAAGGVAQANAGFSESVKGQAALAAGLGRLAQGIGELEKGLTQAADGHKLLLQKLPAMNDGLKQLEKGQGSVREGFDSLISQLGQLNTGLSESVNGLEQISDGLGSAIEYADNAAAETASPLAGWHIPEEALKNEDLQVAFDAYMTKDRKVATLDVVLSNHPYSKAALDSIGDVENAVTRALAGTEWKDARVGIGGVSSIYHDLGNITANDYKRTVSFMIAGIFLILVVLLRSLVMPIYLIGSLLLTYFSSLSITELVFVHGFGYSGLNWTVPFFGFVLLMALGVDYSMFLMDRFNENGHLSVKDAIVQAMKQMGSVIISAAVILSGTFAAMYPSGVLSLLEIATVLLVGLMLYCFVFLPLFVAAAVRLLGSANWWPFMKRRSGAGYAADDGGGHEQSAGAIVRGTEFEV
nr:MULTISPECIES: MMPL family transporter [unclassified Paenibacillus]